ncbi:MAG: HD domain-containing protein, partial [Candidatus Shapirobacteria bacterium]|nr:HD domain-containing protein [Candidatus Shapirobacteria bacterium]
QMKQKGHHLWEVWKHSLLSAQYCPASDPIVRLAALIHDVGKPIVVKDENGQRTFHNHEVVGAALARKIGQRLKLSNKDLNRLTKLVRWHQFSVSEKQTDKALKRFIRRIGQENIIDILAVRTGDRLGSGAKETSWRTESFKKRLIEVQKEPFTITDLKISGRDVMKILNIPPGPRVGQVLANLFNKVEEGQILNNRKDLLKEIKKKS